MTAKLLAIAAAGAALASHAGAGRTTAIQDSSAPGLRGLVVAEVTGRPVRRAVVTLTDADSGVAEIEMADDQGRFTFALLPKARFSLIASKPGFVTTYHGSVRPGRKPSGTLELPAGQTSMAVTIRMIPGAEISGRVSDSLGLPMRDATMEIFETRGPPASRLLSAATVFSNQGRVLTDDLGEYRVWGLVADVYVLKVTISDADAGGRRVTTAADIQWALGLLSPGESSRSAIRNPAAPREANGVRPRSVYYPDAEDSAGAVAIQLSAGEDRSGVKIVVPSRTVVKGH